MSEMPEEIFHDHENCAYYTGYGRKNGKRVNVKYIRADIHEKAVKERDALKDENADLRKIVCEFNVIVPDLSRKNDRLRNYIGQILRVRPAGDCKNETILQMERLCMEALKGGE